MYYKTEIVPLRFAYFICCPEQATLKSFVFHIKTGVLKLQNFIKWPHFWCCWNISRGYLPFHRGSLYRFLLYIRILVTQVASLLSKIHILVLLMLTERSYSDQSSESQNTKSQNMVKNLSLESKVFICCSFHMLLLLKHLIFKNQHLEWRNMTFSIAERGLTLHHLLRNAELIEGADASLKGHRHDRGQCLFTKIIWHEILIEFLQKVIQKFTNHFGKDWAINRAEITHKSLYL